jgi:hypothetical protein
MALLRLFLHIATIRHVSTLTHLLLLSLPRDRELLRDQGVDHGGHVGHQEGAIEPRRCARQGGDPIQFRIIESDFESNSEFKTILPLN